MSSTFPRYGSPARPDALNQFIAGVAAARTAVGWQNDPHRFVVIDPSAGSRLLNAAAAAYPPTHMAAGRLGFVVPRLVAELLVCCAGEGTWQEIACSDDLPAAVPDAALHAAAARWSAIYNSDIEPADDVEGALVTGCFNWNDVDVLLDITIAEIVAAAATGSDAVTLPPAAATLFRQLATEAVWPADGVPEFLAGIAATAVALTR
jgi:hypothetical protein